MTISFTSGSITSTSSEQAIWDVAADEHYAGWIFTHNMQAADTIVIKIYVKDQQGGVLRQYISTTLSGVQTDVAYYMPFVATKEHKVTLQRTAGSDRSYTWQRAEVQ